MLMFEKLTPDRVLKMKLPLSDDLSGDLESDILSLLPVTDFDMDETSFKFQGSGWSIEYGPTLGGEYSITVKGPVSEELERILEHYKVEYVV